MLKIQKSPLIIFASFYISLSCHSVMANDSLQINNELNIALGELVDVTGKIQAMNGPEVMMKFGQIMQQNPDEDTLKAVGESVKYPNDLKSSFDRAGKTVIEKLDLLLSDSKTIVGNAQCQKQIELVEPNYQKVKQAIMEGTAYSVDQSVSRAKAYLSVINSMPLGIVAGKISLVSLVVCRKN